MMRANMRTHTLVALALLSLAGCPKKGGTTATGGGGGKPVADNMADAPKHAFPGSVEVAKAACNQDEYLVLDVPEGTPFTVDIKVSDGCAMLHVMKDNGSTNDMPNVEVCTEKGGTGTLTSVGQAVRTLISVHETGACKGISVSMAFKAGAPAASTPEATPAP